MSYDVSRRIIPVWPHSVLNGDAFDLLILIDFPLSVGLKLSTLVIYSIFRY